MEQHKGIHYKLMNFNLSGVNNASQKAHPVLSFLPLLLPILILVQTNVHAQQKVLMTCSPGCIIYNTLGNNHSPGIYKQYLPLGSVDSMEQKPTDGKLSKQIVYLSPFRQKIEYR